MFRLVEKPWGFEEIWIETEKYVAKKLFIKKGHRLSLQYHERKDETIKVLEGTLLCCYLPREGGEYRKDTLEKGETFRVYPGMVHRFCAIDKDVSLLEVSTPELHDIVRLEDDYSR